MASSTSASLVGDFAVVADFDFTGNEYELFFSQGDVLTVLSRDTENWWKARDSKGNVGMIPSNYVTPLEEEAGHEEAAAGRPGCYSRKLSFNVVEAGRKLVARVEERGGMFEVEVSAPGEEGTKSVKKLTEFAALDAELRRVADDEGMAALASPTLNSQFVAGAIEAASAEKLQQWIQSLLDANSKALQGLAVAFAGRAIEGNAIQEEHVVRRHRVVWPFAPSAQTELPLEAGDIVFVDVAASVEDEGWLLGTSETTGATGYFPAGYVEPYVIEKKQAVAAVPASAPPRARVKPKVTNSSKKCRPHSVKSLASYDALSKRSYAVEKNVSASTSKPGDATARRGDVVTLQCTAYTWDGGSAESKPFASTSWEGRDLSLRLGDGQATEGLEKACTGLSQGDKVTATVAAKLAYGAAGFPPHVKSGSFVVYDIHILNINSSKQPNFVPSGPIALLSRPRLTTPEHGDSVDRIQSTTRIRIDEEEEADPARSSLYRKQTSPAGGLPTPTKKHVIAGGLPSPEQLAL